MRETSFFTERMLRIELGSALYMEMREHFIDVMNRALNGGAIYTPERMVKLYPIFSEIVAEMEESEEAG